mmetsp:Transcript_42007/g.115987  ORF Transcript_42007/g.115987 Transcript_42007/m.115987 type:complete len:330 (+) Transcript_42007:409-1398(+)
MGARRRRSARCSHPPTNGMRATRHSCSARLAMGCGAPCTRRRCESSAAWNSSSATARGSMRAASCTTTAPPSRARRCATSTRLCGWCARRRSFSRPGVRQNWGCRRAGTPTTAARFSRRPRTSSRPSSTAASRLTASRRCSRRAPSPAASSRCASAHSRFTRAPSSDSPTSARRRTRRPGTRTCRTATTTSTCASNSTRRPRRRCCAARAPSPPRAVRPSARSSSRPRGATLACRGIGCQSRAASGLAAPRRLRLWCVKVSFSTARLRGSALFGTLVARARRLGEGCACSALGRTLGRDVRELRVGGGGIEGVGRGAGHHEARFLIHAL